MPTLALRLEVDRALDGGEANQLHMAQYRARMMKMYEQKYRFLGSDSLDMAYESILRFRNDVDREIFVRTLELLAPLLCKTPTVESFEDHARLCSVLSFFFEYRAQTTTVTPTTTGPTNPGSRRLNLRSEG